jgi:hypothetical protein
MEHFDTQRLAILLAAGSGGILGFKCLMRRQLRSFFGKNNLFFIFCANLK